jgi:hypothetical protein
MKLSGFHDIVDAMKSSRRSNGHQRRVLELRRSSAAQPHKNKSKYSRKIKHRGKIDD